MQSTAANNQRDQDPSNHDMSNQFLHKNLFITSDRQRSSQGTVFYFKFKSLDSLGEPDKSIESILKIYPQNEQETYDKEERILRQINQQQFNGFPKILSSIKGQNQSEMILEALGPNLRHLLEASPKRHFSKATTLLIAIQLIERIKDLHQIGWMHNDIKLENILIGYKDSAKIYLIDFGLSQPFIDSQTGHHVQKVNLSYFSGNFMFASLNSCRGNNKSRRDDIESIFYLMIYLYNNNYLPWRDFKGTFKQMIVQRLQLRVTKSLFKMIPQCLEECLKYVLLLNFDEEPKYNYLIEQLKTAYFNEVQATGEKINPNSVKQPVFEWNVRIRFHDDQKVSLATKFSKAQQELDNQWMQGERAMSLSNIDVISTSLMKSRIYLNFNGSNYDSSNNGSANIRMDQSPYSNAENKQMLEQIANMSQGSDNLDSANLGAPMRRPLFQRNGSFNQGSSQFSKFKPNKDNNRTSHSPLQSRHNLIDNKLGLRGGKNSSSDTQSEGCNNQQRGGAVTPIIRKSSFYGQAKLSGQLNVKNQNSSFYAGGKTYSAQNNRPISENNGQISDKASGQMVNTQSQESFSEEDSDYKTPRDEAENQMKEMRKQFQNAIQIQQLEHPDGAIMHNNSDPNQVSYGQANIPSSELDEKVNQFFQVPTQQYHEHQMLLQQPHFMTPEQLQQHQLLQQQLLLQQHLQQQQLQHQQQQQFQIDPTQLAILQNQQNYQLLLQQQQQQQAYQQQLLQQQYMQQQQMQQQQQIQFQLQQQILQQQQQPQLQIHPLLQQLPIPNFAAAHSSPSQQELNKQSSPNSAQSQPYFRVMKVNQNDLKVRGGDGTNSPMRQPSNNHDDDTMMID